MISESPAPSVESQRMSVALLIVLTVVTCGIYSPIWFLKRRRFLNALDSSEQEIPNREPVAILVIWGSSLLISIVLAALGSEGKWFASIDRLATLLSSIMMLMLSFHAKRRIEQHMLRTGRHMPMSGVATFFFQIYYLQYKINQMPDQLDVARRFD